MFRTSFLIFLATVFACTALESSENDEDLDLIEIAGFEVFSNSLKVVDGLTGMEYKGKHPVALGFRRDFDNLLLRFHKRLLVEESKKLKKHADARKPLQKEINAMAASFGFTKTLEAEGPFLTRELAIFRRMVADPFFKIDELVIWDINGLKIRNNTLPDNKYAKNIRLNPETGEWERRILTRWVVAFPRVTNTNRSNNFHTFKEQGFNLDTNKGFHLIDVGLPWNVPSHAFREVDLQYPILVDTAINVDEQIRELSRDFIENLLYIYDPFSWVARGNTRFQYGLPRETLAMVRSERLKIENRKWFDRVLASYFNDVATLNHWPVDVIYAKQMASSAPKNKNVLGQDLDLLNWHKKEKRKVDYDPTIPERIPHISFDNEVRARYILLDAYRRYGDRLTEALRKRVLAIENNPDAKQLVREALEEASGVPADKYIPAAIRAQRAELERYLQK